MFSNAKSIVRGGGLRFTNSEIHQVIQIPKSDFCKTDKIFFVDLNTLFALSISYNKMPKTITDIIVGCSKMFNVDK